MKKPTKHYIDLSHFRMRNHSTQGQNKITANTHEYSRDNLHKKLLNQRQSLPPITSPFLKKTVYGLFSDKNLKHSLPLVHNQESPCSTIMAKFYNNKQVNEPNIEAKGNLYLNNQDISKETDLYQNYQTIAKEHGSKFIKNISDAKHKQRYQLDNLIKSKQHRLRGETRKCKNSRSSTENSQPNSKSIYKRLQDLNQKQQIYDDENSRNKNNGASGTKGIKAPNFVTKQKLAKQLYASQREDIKLVKSILKSSKDSVTLDQFVKVKNYTKFMPGIISISNED